MCDVIYLPDTNEEIETPRQLAALLGVEVETILQAASPDDWVPEDADCCLCHVDIEEAMTPHGYTVEYDAGDHIARKTQPAQ